jgi:hypothetical protein
MSEKRLDFLSLYAGLDIGRPASGQRASLYQAISCFFNKAENYLTILQPKRNRNNIQTLNKRQKQNVPTKTRTVKSSLSKQPNHGSK